MRTIILAGGKGTRLYPLTVSMPKPLVPVGDLPIIDIELRQLKAAGCDQVTLCIGHMGEIIHAYVGDGGRYGLKIDYSREEAPLGTAAPLVKIHDLPDHFLMMNGDVLTTLDYRAFFEAHVGSDAEVSIATYTRTVKIDLGVLKSADGKVEQYIEKPTSEYEVSMGVYALKKSALQHIPASKYFDFPDLIQALLKAKKTVRTWHFSGHWLDIGRLTDYQEAQELFNKHKQEFLP